MTTKTTGDNKTVISRFSDGNCELPTHPYFTRKAKKLLQYKLLNTPRNKLYVDLSDSHVDLCDKIEEHDDIDVVNFEENYCETINIFALKNNCPRCSPKIFKYETLNALLKIMALLITIGLVVNSVPYFYNDLIIYYKQNEIKNDLKQIENQINTIKTELFTLRNFESKTAIRLLEIRKLLENVKDAKIANNGAN